jgi:cell division transport system ATP-binding protein
LIEFFNVSKKYPSGPVALANISLRIDRGELVFLTGPSGAGKTTLLKLIYQEERPDEGQILVNGRNVGSLPSSKVPFLRRSVGVVFQSFRLIRRKTVFENVCFLPRILGLDEDAQRQLCREALAKVGLARRMDAYPSELSGGEQQRVTLARALICDPEIILADEPTGNLDPTISREVMALFLEVNARGTTVILATHDQGLLDPASGRILSLNRGRLVEDSRSPTEADS